MNIFYLARDPREAARALHDKHIVKMCLETAQIMSTVAAEKARGLVPLPRCYRPTHENHPCVKWARESFANWVWLARHGKAIGEEYSHRFRGKVHASAEVIEGLAEWGEENALLWSSWTATPPAQAMPEAYRREDPVEAYRAYYLKEKVHQSRWTNAPVPEWVLTAWERKKELA